MTTLTASRTPGRLRLLDALLSLRLPLAALVYVEYVTRNHQRWGDYGYIVAGANLLFGHGTASGLHLYGASPSLQIGPLSFVVTRGLQVIAPYHLQGALAVAGLVTLLLTLCALERWALARPLPQASVRLVRGSLLTGGCVLALGWADTVTGWGHIDDALTLLFLVCTLWAVRRERASLAGVLLGVAFACKPIAVFAFPLVLALPAWRSRLTMLTVGAAVSTLAFLPFIIADHSTVTALASVRVDVHQWSPLRIFMPLFAPSPGWIRPAQMALGILLGWAMVRAGRSEAILLVVMVARQLFDAGDFTYYTSALMVGVLLIELERAPRARAWDMLGLRLLVPWVVLNWDPFIFGIQEGMERVLILGYLLVLALRPVDLVRAARQRRAGAPAELLTPAELLVASHPVAVPS